ncbi:hypothetical protein [Arthrobacter agilis]|uniref:hypothetical protein n=1 Tax=Arthrobacter agilis TaxID=37921 RepID=UPI00278956EB|nr:hypothetical protein [Arthrobacter agilis]MDQ0734667.1 hypothetical protein [Arthrobacter agilis]
MTDPQAFAEPGEDTAETLRRGFLWRFLQVMAVGSWIPLAYFGLSLIGYRQTGGPVVEIIGGALFLALPWESDPCVSAESSRRGG